MEYKSLNGTRYRVVKKTFADGSQFYYVRYSHGWLNNKIGWYYEYTKGWPTKEEAIDDIKNDIEADNKKYLSRKVIKEEVL